MQQASVAAATLALTMAVAAIATIRQVDVVGAPCLQAHCTAEARAGTAPPPETWHASLDRALVRTERGLRKMAGVAPGG